MNDDLLGQIAGATITAAGGILAAFLGLRASRGERPGIDVHRGQGASDERLKLMHVRVPASTFESPSRGHWLLMLGICMSAAVVCLACYFISTYFFVTTGLDVEWALVGVVPGILGAVFFGFAVAMVQMGMTGAGEHTQKLHVGGGLELVLEGVASALGRMKLRVRSLVVTEGTATIEASGGAGKRNLHVEVRSEGPDRCAVEVKSTMQPSVLSFRRNAAQVTRFVLELTGVRLYPATFERGNGAPERVEGTDP